MEILIQEKIVYLIKHGHTTLRLASGPLGFGQ